jgi:hypothetical protein
MHSDDFQPTTKITWPELRDKLSGQVQETKLKQLNNISQY